MDIKELIGSIKSSIDDFKGSFETHRDETKERMDGFESRLTGIEKTGRVGAISVPGSEGGSAESFSFARAILAIRTGSWKGAEYEQRVFAETREKAAGSLTDDSNLGYLVPNEVVQEIIELLRSRLVLTELGVTFLPNLTGSPVEIPRQTGGATGYWVGENTAPTESNQETDMLRMRPHKAAALTKFSNTLLRAGGDRVEAFVRNDLVETLARTIQTAVFQGTGADGQPLGILSHSNINSVDFASAAPTILLLQKMIEEIDVDNAVVGAVRWCFHSRAYHKIMQIIGVDSNGSGSDANRPIFAPGGNPAGQMPQTILGFPFSVTNDMDYSSADDECDILLGTWSEALLGDWGTLELAATGEAGTAFQNDQTWVRAIQEVDLGLRHEESFCAGTNMTVNAD